MEKWVIAVSGGPDSMALLDMMRIQGVECLVAHVNYNKRVTSLRDQNLIESYCKQYNLQLEILQNHYEGSGNFQAYARTVRYDFFNELVVKFGAKGVMVGHHHDDDVETFLMQKISKRQSDYRGIEPITHRQGLLIVRPLLQQSKEDLIAYCRNHNLEYGHDETNDLDVYTRNRTRQDLARMDGESRKQLEASFEQERLDHLKNRDALLKEVSKMGRDVDSAMMRDTLMLRTWLIWHKVFVYDVSEAYFNEMLRNFKKSTGMYTFFENIVYAQYGKIYIDQVSLTHDVHTSVTYQNFDQYRFSEQGQRIEGLHLNAEDFPILVRNPRPDDYILLRFGKKKLNRYFIDAKIPYVKRKNWLVIENSKKDIVFVVGIGCDIHHYANNSNLFVVKL